MESGPCEKTDHTQVGMGLPVPVKEGDTDTRRPLPGSEVCGKLGNTAGKRTQGQPMTRT